MNLAYLGCVGFLGFFTLLVAAITSPLPIIGWILLFAGLRILASEFEWARWLLDRAGRAYRFSMERHKSNPRLTALYAVAIVLLIGGGWYFVYVR